jgi:hypothetical protein
MLLNIITFLALASLFPGAKAAEELILAKNGTVNADIVVPQEHVNQAAFYAGPEGRANFDGKRGLNPAPAALAAGELVGFLITSWPNCSGIPKQKSSS